MTKITHRTILVGGRGSSRISKMLAELLHSVAQGSDGLHAVIIPEGRNKYYMYDKIMNASQLVGIDLLKFNPTRSEFTFTNGSKVMVVHAGQKESLRGARYKEFYD